MGIGFESVLDIGEKGISGTLQTMEPDENACSAPEVAISKAKMLKRSIKFIFDPFKARLLVNFECAQSVWEQAGKRDDQNYPQNQNYPQKLWKRRD